MKIVNLLGNRGVLLDVDAPEYPTEQEWARRIRMGDAVAFEALAAVYREPVRRHVLRIVRDEHLAEDLLQETLLRLWTHIEQWNERGSLRAWVMRIATNLALNQLRSSRRRPQQPLEREVNPYDEEDESSTPSWMIDAAALGPDELLEQAEDRRLLSTLVAGLPAPKRAVFRLFHESDLPLHEIATRLGIPSGTAKSRLHYANKQLAHRWKELTLSWDDE